MRGVCPSVVAFEDGLFTPYAAIPDPSDGELDHTFSPGPEDAHSIAVGIGGLAQRAPRATARRISASAPATTWAVGSGAPP